MSREDCLKQWRARMQQWSQIAPGYALRECVPVEDVCVLDENVIAREAQRFGLRIERADYDEYCGQGVSTFWRVY